MHARIVDRVLHLSDLHFGADDPEKCWEFVEKSILELEPLPSAVLATGDFSVHPDPIQLKAARSALDNLCRKLADRHDDRRPVELLVCPGNHDLLWYGSVGRNSSNSSAFKEAFGDVFVEAPNYRWIHLRDLSLCITAVDTVKRSRLLAMGRVTESDAKAIERAFTAADKEYCAGRFGSPKSEHRPTSVNLVLMHHSVIPPTQWLEPGSEEPRFLDRFRDYKALARELREALTRMNQAGAVADRLAREHIDLVLHGHDHASCVASYSRTGCGKGGVQLLGTTSSTGTVDTKDHSTLHAWRPDRAGYDCLDVNDLGELLHVPYRSRTIDNLTSIMAGEHELVFDAKHLRRSMFYRARRSLKRFQALPDEVRLHRQFRVTSDGEVYVTRIFSGLRVREPRSCSVVAHADSPAAIDPLGGYGVDEDGRTFRLTMGPFVEDPNKSGRFLSKVDMRSCPTSVREVQLGYVIRGAICMNRTQHSERLSKLASAEQEPDQFLAGCMEMVFSTIHSPPHAKSVKPSDLDQLVPKHASLSLHFDESYWQLLDRSRIRVFVRAEAGGTWMPDGLLTSRLYWLPNSVMLTVGYPALGGAYGIAWEIPADPKERVATRAARAPASVPIWRGDRHEVDPIDGG